jgi:hypothetical protein
MTMRDDMIKIKVTDDKELLARVWSDEYAEKNAGKTYMAEIEEDGWAGVSTSHGSYKFPRHAYEIISEDGDE